MYVYVYVQYMCECIVASDEIKFYSGTLMHTPIGLYSITLVHEKQCVILRHILSFVFVQY